MKRQQLEEIDPALGFYKDFAKISKNTVNTIQNMRQEAIFTDGVLPAKWKTLAAVLWAISARCEPCIKFYVIKAKEFGATESELGELLAIGSTMGGCVGEMWGLKAFKAFKENVSKEDLSCCE